ncbi:MAG: hypothetical protein LBP63_11205 [Prevotellaceae bacterium]|jgi:hypothetical protein|nr:hypothetical protein [Prevotellaceae bacterium]
MKKLIYTLLIAASVIACSKDDEMNINTNPKNIVGNWKCTYIYADDSNSEIDFTKYNTYYYQESSKPVYLTFLADTACGMIYWIDNRTEKTVYSYAINGDRIWKTATCEIHDADMTFRTNKWSIIDKKLIMASGNGSSNVIVYTVFHKQ